jgi:hypothetical protein
MDTTLFNIGACLILSTLLLGLLGLEGFKERNSIVKPFLFATLVCLLIAGLLGGVVASNIPYFAKFEDLRKASIGLYSGWPTAPLAFWTFIEHLAFWAGIIIALGGAVFATYFAQKAPTRAEAARLARRLSGECLEASIIFRELQSEFEQAQKSLADAARKAARDLPASPKAP